MAVEHTLKEFVGEAAALGVPVMQVDSVGLTVLLPLTLPDRVALAWSEVEKDSVGVKDSEPLPDALGLAVEERHLDTDSVAVAAPLRDWERVEVMHCEPDSVSVTAEVRVAQPSAPTPL